MRIGELLHSKIDCLSETDYIAMLSHLMVMYSLGLLKAGVDPNTLKMIPQEEMNQSFFAVKVIETRKGSYLIDHDFLFDAIAIKYGQRTWLHG